MQIYGEDFCAMKWLLNILDINYLVLVIFTLKIESLIGFYL